MSEHSGGDHRTSIPDGLLTKFLCMGVISMTGIEPATAFTEKFQFFSCEIPSGVYINIKIDQGGKS